jgi:hypothetical protein
MGHFPPFQNSGIDKIDNDLLIILLNLKINDVSLQDGPTE